LNRKGDPVKADVINVKKDKAGEIELNDEVFNGPAKEHLFSDVIRLQLANRRKGTASTKTRSEVRGGGSKPWRQKGRGRARVGTIRSPIWRGGGIIFGPHPRNYGFSMPKKARRSAIRGALSLKQRQGKLMILDAFQLDVPRTKAFLEIARGLEIEGALLVTEGPNRNLELSTRNLKNFKVLRFSQINLYDLLKYNYLVMEKAAVPMIEGVLVK